MRKLRRLTGGRLLPCALLALFFASCVLALTLVLPRLLAPVALAGLALSLAAALAVAAGEEPAEYKISKLVLILLLPWTGAVLCLIWKNPPHPHDFHKIGETKGDLMGRAEALISLHGQPPARAETIEYFPVGKEMAERLIADLAAAEHSVFLQYYIIAQGEFFSEVLRTLEVRARAGVDVRILYDDFGCSLTLPRNFAKTLSKSGVKACPVRRLRFPTRSAGRRDHRKLAVIDGRVAYTGGVNLADEYIGARIRFGHWKDTAVRIEGAAALRFSALFAAAWREACGEAIKIPQNRQNAVGFGVPCAVFSDGADGGERLGAKLIFSALSAAGHTFYLTTPYLAPPIPVMAALKNAAERGVDVRLMIPRIPDKKLPFFLTLSYARELMRSGVGVRMYTAGFLHAKSFVADGQYASVSSYNLDFRSLYLQAECGALFEDGETARAIERDFLSAWKAGTDLPAERPAAKFFARLLRLFAPLV